MGDSLSIIRKKEFHELGVLRFLLLLAYNRFMTTLTTALTFRNEAGLDVPALLSYDENDTLASTIIFLDEAMSVEWVFARDLFLEAFTQGSAGMGDGVISLLRGRFTLTLSSAFGRAVLHFPRRQAEAYTFMAQGNERVEAVVDEWLTHLFE